MRVMMGMIVVRMIVTARKVLLLPSACVAMIGMDVRGCH
jgi:hypothetical protein